MVIIFLYIKLMIINSKFIYRFILGVNKLSLFTTTTLLVVSFLNFKTVNIIKSIKYIPSAIISDMRLLSLLYNFLHTLSHVMLRY